MDCLIANRQWQSRIEEKGWLILKSIQSLNLVTFPPLGKALKSEQKLEISGGGERAVPISRFYLLSEDASLSLLSPDRELSRLKVLLLLLLLSFLLGPPISSLTQIFA